MPEFDSETIYADIPGHPGYKAGSDGTIWSCRGRGGLRGEIITSDWRELKQGRELKGYRNVRIHDDDGTAKTYKVHRLVLESLVRPRECGEQCRHLNGIPSDNRLINIQWGTKSENESDKDRHGTQLRGEKRPLAKLTSANIRLIRSSKLSQRSLARQFGVCKATIRDILKRKIWRHVD